MDFQIHTCNFVLITDIVGDEAGFYSELADINEFTWGTSSRSLVTAGRLANVMVACDLDSEFPEILARLKTLDPTTLVDLEN